MKIDGARGVLFSVAGGYDMAMSEIQEAAEIITGAVSPDANIIFGASVRPDLEDEMVVTVVATGFDSEYYRKLDAQKANLDTPIMSSMGSTLDTMPVREEPRNMSSISYGASIERNNEPTVNSRDSRDTRDDFNNGGRVEYGNTASVDNGAAEFTSNNRTNMWDSIRTNETEDDLDVPPTLRDRLRGKNRD